MSSLLLTNTKPSRLDIALAATLGISRTRAQKMILAQHILVDGTPGTAHQQVSHTSLITIDQPPSSQKISSAPPVPLAIIYENHDIIVVNKPSGLLVHATPTSTESTLVDSLRAYLPNIDQVGDDKQRSGLVHRLDKEASGVLIIAKNHATFLHLKQQFALRTTEKHYTVLVNGNVIDPSGTITFPITRSKTHARMAARPQSQDGKPAITHFDVIKRYTNATLLDVRIETGRTHQIRAHFFALGHPVVGDKLYVQRGLKSPRIHRLFLHATSLTVTLPTQERMTFTAPLPDDLKNILDTFTETKKKALPGIGTFAV